MSDHASFQGWSAGYVLGALEPVERREFEQHLAECDACRREVGEFAPIPGLLAKVDPGEVEVAPPELADRAVHQVQSEWAQLDRSRRRWQSLTAIAASFAFVIAIGSGLPFLQTTTVLVIESPVAASGTIELDERAWGTAVHLDLRDLPHREGYIAWVFDEDGEKQQVAVWGPTDDGSAVLDSTSSVFVDAVTKVTVTDLSGEERLALAEA